MSINIKVGEKVTEFEYSMLFENGTYETTIKKIYIKEDFYGKSGKPIAVVYELVTEDGIYEFEDFLFLKDKEKKLEKFLLAAYNGEIPPEPQLEDLEGLCGWIELRTRTGKNGEYNTAVSWDFSSDAMNGKEDDEYE